MPGMFDTGLFKSGGGLGNAGSAVQRGFDRPTTTMSNQGQGSDDPLGAGGGGGGGLTGLDMARDRANGNALGNAGPLQAGWTPGMRDVLNMGRPTAFPGQGGVFPGQGTPSWGGGTAIPGQGLGRPWGY